MKVDLLNMGFVPRPEGIYINLELGIKVKIVDTQIWIETKDGPKVVTIKDLENVMLGGQL
jgi:hypothetical protein